MELIINQLCSDPVFCERKNSRKFEHRFSDVLEMVTKRLFLFVLIVLCHCSSFVVLGTGVFTNTWAVKIAGDGVVLERLARKHGFVNESQVSGKIICTLCRKKKIADKALFQGKIIQHYDI